MSFQAEYTFKERRPFRRRGWFGPRRWTSLSDAVQQASRVQELEVGFNHAYPPQGADFTRLHQLRSLALHGAGPTSWETPCLLPIELGQLTRLRELLVLNIALAEVPLWLTALTELRYLMLRGTDITKLPATISNLQQLELLRIENCQESLTTLPASLRKLNTLRYLSFRDTYVRHLPVSHLPPGLTHLELSYSSLLAGANYDELHSRFPKLRVCLNGVR